MGAMGRGGGLQVILYIYIYLGTRSENLVCIQTIGNKNV